MTIPTISFSDALRARQLNKARDWCSYDARGAFSKPGSALARFEAGGFFSVENSPKFKLSRKDKVYTIGSCFAREIERALIAAGMVVPTADVEIDPSLYRSPTKYKNTILNKYNPYSMVAELLRGLGRLTLPDRGLLEVAGQYYDPQTSHIDPLPREKAVNLRDILDTVAAEIRSSSVFVFTLGLTETWFDTRTGQAFNGMNVATLRSISQHLGFHNLRHSVCYSLLREAFIALKMDIPLARVIITVSPVPLTNTFTSMDVVTANAYSKSTLRSVAQELFEDLDFVDYYPSYEMVMTSPRIDTWAPDQVHVRDEIVAKVINTFITRYFSD